jgi:hypothetical protein
LVVAAVSGPVAVCADVFVLRNGGQIRGRWLNREDHPPRQYLIATEHGGRLSLDAGQVQQAILESSAQDDYERVRSKFPDTADGQWQAAQWCREHGLAKQRTVHLWRVVELDPDHAGARHALGYSQVRGRWVTHGQVQGERGLELEHGQWRYPQEIALTSAQLAVEQSDRDWLQRLRLLRLALDSDKARTARDEIAAIRDPQAVTALSQMLAGERVRRVKFLYLEVLEQVATPAAIQALYCASLQDPDEEVFHSCLDRLVKLNPPRLATQYVSMLKDANNVRLNRAAHALGRLGDKSVISPLIDVLVTTHYAILPAKNQAYTASFDPSGATGFSAGDSPKAIPHTVTNQEVLQALIRLSGGVNYGFDQRAWKFWLANENRKVAPQVNARRDSAP